MRKKEAEKRGNAEYRDFTRTNSSSEGMLFMLKPISNRNKDAESDAHESRQGTSSSTPLKQKLYQMLEAQASKERPGSPPIVGGGGDDEEKEEGEEEKENEKARDEVKRAGG
ncbi:hypothetical protein PRK78_000482 [Emydomyces testavorans]|uniref:Uncharacterized protein n=1 Tax=Emydomyces testavorans TaxID=2070801 RepID=A0AAF0DBI0_9EURO|nr:hypothetical protein PRK78_000482 [Emydomyces testavorans]